MSRILIVEDESYLRRVLIEFLLKLGYHAADAATGPLALAILPLFKPDLILLDILMPGMDGIEVLRRMREWNPDVPIVMLTAVDKEDVAQKAMELGAVDYLTKPFHFDQLETLITVHLMFHGDE